MLFKFKAKKPENHVELGKHGEELAAGYLKKKGYSIITRNYRKRFGEVDIIALDGDTLVFVEVKTRKSSRFGSGIEAVDLRKQQQLSRIAADYLVSEQVEYRQARFDVIAVELADPHRPRFTHIPNAFDAQNG